MVQSEKFVLRHQGEGEHLSIFGRELISTTWKPCKMNLAIRGLEGNIGKNRADAFHNDVWSKYGFQIFCNQIKVSHEKWEELFWK